MTAESFENARNEILRFRIAADSHEVAYIVVVNSGEWMRHGLTPRLSGVVSDVFQTDHAEDTLLLMHKFPCVKPTPMSSDPK